jgi:pyruvate dehydrogenase E2 component (dihydrolipoamide acetyltransferase)
VTATVALLDGLRAEPELSGLRLTPLAAVAKALCLAVRRHPEVNARWDGDAGEILRFRRVHLGIAVATPRGLLVPVLPDAGDASLPQLARGIAELSAAAREGRSSPAALSGSTITITNVGVFGVDAGTPILNAGEAAILAVGAVTRRPWEWQGGIALRDVVTLSLSVDHRVLDGEQGARFLAEIGRLLADPARAFAT